MFKSLLSRFASRFENRVIVLMYHRIANRNSDPWQIAVSPENFEQHLQILKKSYQVISIPDLVRQLENKKIETNCVCITFDDAYCDNYLYAKPLLEKYELPATFFVASDYIGQNKQFWWDELEKIILHSERLPFKLSTTIGGQPFEFNLEKEHLVLEDKEKHRTWIWEELPPTSRCELYLELWKALKPLQEIDIDGALTEIRKWALYRPNFNKEDVAMSNVQLQEMCNNPLFTIGIHTLSHPALATQGEILQANEITGCKKFLEDLNRQTVHTIAYPYGSYNEVTLSVVAKEKLAAGFTTQAQVVNKSSKLFELGRFQVVNQDSEGFEKSLSGWFQT
ncbi:MAG TPA: polysaccharide deacetylase family protein [Pedobacter sp.]|jgi:peptidoglycan/xylan/chitin deacetylase (PgdA/CDA1 family)